MSAPSAQRRGSKRVGIAMTGMTQVKEFSNFFFGGLFQK